MKLEELLKLYAEKRRGEEIKQSFDELKTIFKASLEEAIKNGEAIDPEKSGPFALELYNKYTNYIYSINNKDGVLIEATTLKELKEKIGEEELKDYKVSVKMKEAEKKSGEFFYYKQWWKSKVMEFDSIEKYILSTSLGFDIYVNRDILFGGSNNMFYIKSNKNILKDFGDEVKFVLSGDVMNKTEMPSWMKKIDSGTISIWDVSSIEKAMEFIGDKIKGVYTAKRETEDSDFWSLNTKILTNTI